MRLTFKKELLSEDGEGCEYHLLVTGIALALLIQGGDKWSLDRALAGGK